MIAVGLVAVLQQLGVQTTSIIAVLGAASLAIGLALQGALSNVAAGVMILLFRPYRVGDYIETVTRQGTVKSLDLLFTEIATPDNVKVMIPNSKVFGDVILNYSSHRSRRADVLFKVPLKTDLVMVLKRLRERAESDARIRKEPAVMIEVVDLSEAFAQAAIRVWTAGRRLRPGQDRPDAGRPSAGRGPRSRRSSAAAPDQGQGSLTRHAGRGRAPSPAQPDKAASRSEIRSRQDSIPTESLIRPSEMPRAAR